MNLKKSIFVVAFLAIVSSIVFTSCEKDDIVSHDDSLQNGTEIREKKQTRGPFVKWDFPIIRRNVCVFRDASHFKQFYSQLDVQLDKDEYEIEKIFNSRQTFKSIFVSMLEDRFANPANRYQPSINDFVLQYLLNTFNEVQIGDVLLTFINDETFLAYPSDNGGIRKSIRNLLNQELADFLTVKGVRVATIDELDNALLGSWCGCTLNMSQTDCCTLRLWGHCGGFFFQDVDGNVSIDFIEIGIGGSRELDVDINGSYDVSMNVCDFFPANAPINFTLFEARAGANICGGPTEVTSTFNMNSSCDAHDRDTGWGWEENGPQAISMNVSLSGSKAKTSVYSYTFDGSEWENTRADNIYVQITHGGRGIDCLSVDPKDDDKDRSNRRYAKVRQRNNDADFHCNGDISGIGTISNNGSFTQQTREIEFDCCQ